MIQDGGGGGGLNREGELINFPPLKRRRLVRERGIYGKTNKEVF